MSLYTSFVPPSGSPANFLSVFIFLSLVLYSFLCLVIILIHSEIELSNGKTPRSNFHIVGRIIILSISPFIQDSRSLALLVVDSDKNAFLKLS